MAKGAADPVEIEVRELVEQLRAANPPTLIDVRESDECASGILDAALQFPHASMASRLAQLLHLKESTIVLYCASGARSARAAQTLLAMGFASVRSLRGGIAEWRRQGGACVVPMRDSATPLLNDEQLARYARHIRLDQVGIVGQRRLLDSKVLCIGAGGLGSPASLYLAAAGVGTLGLVDDDRVEHSNLQRQILHTTARVGSAKALSGSQTLTALNPETRVVPHTTRLTAANALDLIQGYDIIVDGSDNFATRYLVNDAALRLGKPVVFGAVQQFEGQVSLFAGAPCYRCLFPEPPPAEVAPSCEEAGVLGVLPGVIGVLQAAETLKWLLGIGESLLGRLVVYDALTTRFTELHLEAHPQCPVCAPSVDRRTIELRSVPAACADTR
jgi:molybdopterin/thiamine biosynthesis adenylyltransferase/rhodanese-related sulfurtransferase